MRPMKTFSWMIHVGAIVKLEVPADVAEADINDIVGFFVLLHDASDASDRGTLQFRINEIKPQDIHVEPFIGEADS